MCQSANGIEWRLRRAAEGWREINALVWIRLPARAELAIDGCASAVVGPGDGGRVVG